MAYFVLYMLRPLDLVPLTDFTYKYHPGLKSTKASRLISTINVKVFASDKRCITGGQEHDRISSIFRITDSSQWTSFSVMFHKFGISVTCN